MLEALLQHIVRKTFFRGVATHTGYDSLDDLRCVDSKALPALSARLHGCRVTTSAAGCGGDQQSHHRQPVSVELAVFFR